MTTEEYLIARKSKNWKFNRVVDNTSFRNVNKIHPIKQNIVKDIVAVQKCPMTMHIWMWHVLRHNRQLNS